MKAFIVYADYDIIDEKTNVLLYGRLENGQSFVSVHKLEPYFFIKTSDSKKLSKYFKAGKFQLEETNLKTFQGDKVSKISGKNHTELNKLHHLIHKSINTYESDIKPNMRFIIDNNLLGSLDIEGDYESSERLDRIYKNPRIKPIEYEPKLKIISFDIESSSDGKLYCIGIYTHNYRKNFMVTNHKLKDVVPCKSDIDCLEKFKSEIQKLDPDIITGWNIIDFDLKYLQDLFRKHKMQFDIGRNNANLRLRLEENFFRSSSADLPGRQIIDALNLIRDPFIQEAPSIKNAEFDTYTLEDVSQAILGEGKLLKGKKRHEEIDELYKKNTEASHQKLADYNMQDCKLVHDIIEKTKMIDLAIERSQLTGMPLDRLLASIAAFDSLYIREARNRGLVSPTTEFSKKEEKITGGYVKETTPGIYHNIVVLDFKSLYPSILKTFNIDPSSFLGKHKEKDSIESPNNVYFKNQQGVLPNIITRLHSAREKAKKEHRELSSYAIKIIMNSFWGVLASPNCRYFDFDMANAITGFARFIIQLTAKEIESKFKTPVIYQDTDSCFVETKLNKKEANELGKSIQEHINDFYKKYVKENYNRESFLELEFQKQYIAFMMPQLRMQKAKKDDNEEETEKESKAKGAKKRYAGLIEKNGKEELEIVGMEAIRGDWVDAARDFQRELLLKTFKKEPLESFIKEYIKKIKSGKLDEKLIYKKSIRKNLAEYTKTTPPHVKAARKLENLDSSIIQYCMTTDGPEPIQKLTHKIDYEHYIKKQIQPIANQVLVLLGKSFEDIEKSSKQSKLF